MSESLSFEEFLIQFESLSAAVAAQQDRIAQLEEAIEAKTPSSEAGQSRSDGFGSRSHERGSASRDINRRRLLTGGAIVAVGGVGAVFSEAGSAAAATSGPYLGLGNNDTTTNTATAQTQLYATVPSVSALNVINTDGTGQAVYGQVGGSSGMLGAGALIGDTDQKGFSGVFAKSSDGPGLSAFSTNDWGVHASSASQPGVFASSSGDVGVLALSDASYGLSAGGGGGRADIAAIGDIGGVFGRILSKPFPADGAPTGGSYEIGEQIRDASGQMWLCTIGGSPGTWERVATVAPGATGGSINMLPSPFRLYDSRAGLPSAITTPKRQLQHGAAGALELTATGHGGIPSKAIGIFGTMTVTDTHGGGYVTLYPSGQALPPTSNVNWTGADQTVGGSFTCALSSAGSVTIYNGGGEAVDVIVDIAGYVY